MSKYLVLWKANPAAWPTDPKQSLATVEQATAGGEELLQSGAIEEMGWLTAQDGFAIFNADSKDSVLGMLQPFFPYFTQEVHEIVPWENGRQAVLGGARQAAAR